VGYLYYGAGNEPIEMPDRLLAHVKVVIATKLRRNESFTMTWQHPAGTPSGRTTIWLQPAIELRFVFKSPEADRLDSEMLQRFANAASSSAGLVLDLAEEPAPAARAVRSPRVRLLQSA
jgi:hypothetical protein